MFSPCHHYHRYLHPHCPIRIRFLHHPITLWSLRYLHTHMQPPISCSLSTPFLFIVSLMLSVHSLLFLSFSLCLSVSPSLRILSSWILGVTGMRCSVWLGCGGFLWVVGLYGGSWWVSVVVRWVGFAIWYRWVLISVVLIDFGGFLISMARFVSWLGWLWVLGVGWSGWFWVFVVILWFFDLDDSLILWLWMWRWFFFWVDMVAGGAGLWKRDTEERETEKERGRIKNDKGRIFKWSVKKIEVLM